MSRIYLDTGPPPGAQNDAAAQARGGRGVPSNGFQKRAQLPSFDAGRQAWLAATRRAAV
jgi:hypothetical protein